MPQPIRGTRADSRPTHDPATALAALAAAVPAWVADGLCGQVDPEVFFPPKGTPAEPAKAICRACPVRAECLEYALDNHEHHGVWGGTTDDERRALQRARQRRAVA
jgi:WhiB family redox-sensing transcriptional regulator